VSQSLVDTVEGTGCQLYYDGGSAQGPSENEIDDGNHYVHNRESLKGDDLDDPLEQTVQCNYWR
jgi:hypothetical protein